MLVCGRWSRSEEEKKSPWHHWWFLGNVCQNRWPCFSNRQSRGQSLVRQGVPISINATVRVGEPARPGPPRMITGMVKELKSRRDGWRACAEQPWRFTLFPGVNDLLFFQLGKSNSSFKAQITCPENCPLDSPERNWMVPFSTVAGIFIDFLY